MAVVVLDACATIAYLRGNPDAALARLVEELESHAPGPDDSSTAKPVRLTMLKFKAGPSTVAHPALVLPDG